ncbi:MAG TPA: metal-dependent hydrolase, partial [Bryobacteraceae bacterium]|nr:metal-dependent hydrolase [Bryobacteraceae bacterium]
ATGLFLGRAGLNRFSEQAPWILVLAANAPDIDIVTLAGGQLNYLNYHRHLTHSLAALPVMALLPVLAVRLFTRKPFSWLGAYVISLAAVASHLLLDYTNVYGIRFLLPFSARWFHLDLTSVVDLWIWAVLLVALAGPLIARLVNAEIGARTKNAGRGLAIFALLFLALYNAGRGVLHTRAVATLGSRVYAGAPPQRVAALPGPVNPLAWRGLVETGELYDVVDFSLLEEFDPSRGAIFYKAESSSVLKAANNSPVFRDFFKFSQFPLERTVPLADPDGATRVEATDLRFGTPAQPRFIAVADVNNRLQVVRASFTFGPVGR